MIHTFDVCVTQREKQKTLVPSRHLGFNPILATNLMCHSGK